MFNLDGLWIIEQGYTFNEYFIESGANADQREYCLQNYIEILMRYEAIRSQIGQSELTQLIRDN